MVKISLPSLEREKAELLVSIMLAMLLGSLDQTIVATAMPHVVAQLGGLSIFSWVFIAYMITSTIAVMLTGKLGDMKGRKNIYFYGILIFIIGSALSGFSTNMLMLILCRGFQGIGAGIMMISAMAILGDIFPPAERARWQGVVGSVYALSSVIGPVAGAFITEHIGWRFIFFVNLPLGIIVLYLLSRATHVQPKTHGHKLDIMGAAYFTVFVICFMTYIVSALGSLEPIYLALLLVSLISFALFLREEKRAEEPLLPLDVCRNRTFGLITSASFIIAMAMFGAVTFLPLLTEYALGGKTMDAGVVLTPEMLSVFFGSAVAGQIVSRTNRYKFVAIGGCALVCIGAYLLTTIGLGSSLNNVIIAGIVLGFGIGSMLPLSVVVVQNTFEHARIGTVTSALTFFRSLGSAFGVAAMGALMNTAGPAEVIMMTQTTVDAKVMMTGLHSAFLFLFAVSFVPIVLMLFLKEIPLRRTHGDIPAAQEIGIELAEDEEVLDPERAALGKQE